MVIELDKSFITASESPILVRALHILFGAIRDGHHFIIAEIEVVFALKKWKSLSCFKDVFIHLRKKTKRISSFKKNINFYLLVQATEDFYYEHLTNYAIISASWFETSIQIQMSRLVCEGKDDVNIFMQIAKAWSAPYKMFQIKLCLELDFGGGGNMGNKIELILQRPEKQISLFIVDSDKTSESSNKGSTAITASDTFQEKKSKKEHEHITLFRKLKYPTSLAILKVRELENLIPRNLIKNAVPREYYQKLSQTPVFIQNSYGDLKEEIGYFLPNVATFCCNDELTPQKLAEYIFNSSFKKDENPWEELCALLWDFGCAGKPMRLT